MSERWNWSLLVVVLVAAIIMLFNLGGIPLLDPDEPVYAETAKEMLAFNDFLSPRIYGEYWYDKPPMYYWLVAGAFKLFGIGEFAARFPSALLAIACVVFVYFSAARLFDQRAGMVSALVLATSIEFFYLGKAAVTDITLTICLTIALLSFLEKRYYLFYIGAALATVTKGPIGFLFPAAVVFLYLLITRKFSRLAEMKIPAGIILYLIIALPWYFFMYRIHGAAFIDTFLGFHNIVRFTSPEHPEGVLWHYFIPVLIAGFFPWTAVMAQSVWKAITNGRENSDKLIFLLVWAAFIFLFFSVSRTKLVSYILPMYPPLAIVAGWYISHVAEGRNRQRPFVWPVLLTVLTVLFCVALHAGVKYMPSLLPGAVVAGAIFCLMTIGVWYYVWRLKIDRAFWLQVASMTLFSLVLLSMLFPQAAPAFHSRDIATEFTARYDGKSPVYVVKFLRPGFAFYSGVYGQELKDDQLADAALGNQRAYFVVRLPEYNKLKEAERQKLLTLAVADEKVLLLKP